jgi:hypothetical protein
VLRETVFAVLAAAAFLKSLIVLRIQPDMHTVSDQSNYEADNVADLAHGSDPELGDNMGKDPGSL